MVRRAQDFNVSLRIHVYRLPSHYTTFASYSSHSLVPLITSSVRLVARIYISLHSVFCFASPSKNRRAKQMKIEGTMQEHELHQFVGDIHGLYCLCIQS